MRISIDGTNGINFPDVDSSGKLITQSLKTQTSQGVHLTGGTAITGNVVFNHVRVGTSSGGFVGDANAAKHIRQWDAYWSHPQNTTVSLMTNAASYQDVNFKLVLVSYHSSISYQQWTGVFGGYGISSTSYGHGAFTLGVTNPSAGFGTLQLSTGALTGGYGACYASMMIFGHRDINTSVGSFF